MLDEAARERLVGNIAGHVSKVTVPDILERAFQYWEKLDPQLGERVRVAVSPEAPGSNEDPARVGIPA